MKQSIMKAKAAAKTKIKRVMTKSSKKLMKLTKHGQNIPTGAGCLSTNLNGKACPNMRVSRGVPYCSKCVKTGDPSLKVCEHPKFGKILVANRELKKPYYAAWWGTLMPKSKLPYERQEWALQTPKGFIDAIPHEGSQLKYCACPGPNELPTINFSSNHDALLEKASKTCLLFSTMRDIPKNYQVTMMYNEDEKTTKEFFEERGLVRGDVGTKEHPSFRKKNAEPVAF